jgi:hypothetical protein
MNTLRNIFKNLLTGLFMVGVLGSFAQADRLNRANTLYQGKKFDAARLAIDSVVQHPETHKDPSAWTLRAYTYYEIYKATDKYKLYSPLRDTILNSIRISNSLKPDGDYQKNNNKLAFNISVGYYNLAKRLLQDSLNDKTSQVAYTKSKEVVKMFKPDSNFTVADVEWYNTVGGIFSDIFNKDNTNVKAQETAKVALLKVIELQPENWRSNYNLGIMYYNQAVNLGKSLDYGADISQIDVIQESIIKLAKQAEQLIDKVYKKDNKNAKAAEALYYIYRMLNDNTKTDFFKKKCIELGVKVD